MVCRRSVYNHVVDVGGIAHVPDPVVGLAVEDGLAVDVADADVDPALGRHAPGQAPAIAVEHWHSP